VKFALFVMILAAPLASQSEEVVRNGFKDPYFQVRSGIARCPAPLGPYITEESMRNEAHVRTERGTRCWVEKKCTKPNSYLYDPEIAQAVRSRFESTRALGKASLWVTIQRRVVWVEGCVPPGYAKGTLEKLLKGVPDVEQLIVTVTRDPGARPGYRTLGPGQRRVED
jgi:BON domain